MSEYFEKHDSDKWSIKGFLFETNIEPYQLKIDQYLRCLDTIAISEKGKRKKKAELLLVRFREGSKSYYDCMGSQIDRKTAKEWENKRSREGIHIHQPISGVSGNVVVGNINSEISVAEPSSKKRGWEEIQDDDKVKHRRTRSGRGILNFCKPVLPEIEENVESSGSEKNTILNVDHEDLPQGNDEETSSGGKRSKNTSDSDSTSPVEVNKIKSGERNGNFEEVDNDDAIIMTSTAYRQFTDKYQKFPKEGKWTLSTGKVIEDALYTFGMDCPYEHLSHSFIIDPDDKKYIQKGIFTHEEISEIINFNKKELPLMPDDLLKYLNNFRKSNTPDLRELIFRSDLRDQPFDRLKDFDYDWIRNTIYNLVLEYEANHFAKDHLEAWNMWSFVDKAFLNIDGIEIIREEPTISLKRKLMGRCGDLIIQKCEAGKIFEENNGTKIIQGGLKIPKMLRYMLDDLCEEMQESKIRKLETIGFIIAGLKISLIRLDLPMGHVCRLSRTRLFEIPTQVSEFGKKALPTISLIWKAKAIVKNVIKLMEEEDLTEEQQLLILQLCVEDGNGLRTLPPP